MIVDGITCDETVEGWRLSAAVHSPSEISGERLHFTVPGADPSWLPEVGDAFLAALLMPAMSLGEELVIEAPVSRRLLRSARTVMDIYSAWWDHLRPVRIRTGVGSQASIVCQNGVGLFFTTGVDCFYSLLKDIEYDKDPLHEPVTHLLFANFEQQSGDDYDRLLDRLRRVAEGVGRRPLVVDTNVRSFTAKVAHWEDYHGAALGSVALALQGLLGRCLIAASDHYRHDLPPWGSHSVLDHLWSTESLEIVHDGAEATRMGKVERRLAGSSSEVELAERLPTGTILLHGGGNLGDLWPRHQQLRERIISAFPRHRIIQLPQSIHFGDRSNLDRARAVFDAHPDLTLLVRDHRSLQVARKEFQARSVLSPDSAFGITELPGPHLPQHRVLWLARADHEAAGHTRPPLGPGVHLTDWAGGQGADPPWLEHVRATERDRDAAVHCRMPDAIQVLCRACDRHAELQVLRGCRLLGSGHAVVTDRLHAHVLSLLLGVPHAVLNDRHGKVRSHWETWTHDWPATSWAQNPQQALERAEAMADAGNDESGSNHAAPPQ